MSGDLRLTWDIDEGSADLSIESNDLATDAGMQTAVLLSLFTDRRADDGADLPDGETERRGWWADAHPVVEGDKIGSRLWMLDRAKNDAATLQRAEEYAREALQWMVDDGVASSVEATASVPRDGMLGLKIEIMKPSGEKLDWKFGAAWAAEE